MSSFHYVYMLIDIETSTHHYVGVTEDLHARLAKHNRGEVPYTAKYRPWRLQTAIAFDSTYKEQLKRRFSDKLLTGTCLRKIHPSLNG